MLRTHVTRTHGQHLVAVYDRHWNNFGVGFDRDVKRTAHERSDLSGRGAPTFGKYHDRKSLGQRFKRSIDATDSRPRIALIHRNLSRAFQVPTYEGDFEELKLGKNTKLEWQ